ncbi:MAG: NAD(P)H-hydrate dehydratase [Rhizobiales bacterium]|nr:NAD(P)H-hydrate dehydratase [Hyphomicrobiales bacterium]
MAHELLTPDEMVEVDWLAIEAGPFTGIDLMRRAGAAVAAEILARFPDAAAAHVLCGPGNNGGDGYVVARLLAEAGVDIRVWSLAPPKPGTDAALAAGECPVPAHPLGGFRAAAGEMVVDALFGAGLSKPITGVAAEAVAEVEHSGARVVAIDLPSGISGASGRVLGVASRAELTVTFFRLKPGHLLYPGRGYCGETVMADIGIRDDVLEKVRPGAFENAPALWQGALPFPGVETHKYKRGHACVFSGGPSATGAARLAAMAAARIGVGAVTVLSPAAAMLVNASHLTAIMLAKVDDVADLGAFAEQRKPNAFVLGPGFGVGEKARELALAVLENGDSGGLVLDADGITSFRDAPASLFITAGSGHAPPLVLTPHEGEFARLFPGLAEDAALSKLDKARRAAERSHAVVIYKGPDTVIAAPDGRAAINANGTPFLATAGSGDVLAGITAGLLAQGMPAFEAACAAVWMHAEAGSRFGAGLIAEDLPGLLPEVLEEVFEAIRSLVAPSKDALRQGRRPTKP